MKPADRTDALSRPARTDAHCEVRGRRIRLLVLFLGLSALASASTAGPMTFHRAPPETDGMVNPYADPPSVLAGKGLYSENCAACHGRNAEGSGNIPALAHGAVQAASDGAVFWFITKGSRTNAMPSWARLPEKQRWQIVAYVKTLKDAPQAIHTAAALPDWPAAPGDRLDGNAPPAPFSDFRYQAPGRHHRITVEDLPSPFATAAASNAARIVPRPAGVLPLAPSGFKVNLYAEGLDTPRVIRRAPNGDIFVAESGAGRIRVYRGITAAGTPARTDIFADKLNRPYGIDFYPPGPDPQWLYVADTDAVRRFAYRNGDLVSTGKPVRLIDLPHGGGHWTRDLRFSPDGKSLFVAIGSASNVDDPDDNPDERDRARIMEFNPDGSNPRVYASGIRNPSGLAIDPQSGRLWCTVNERDGLGDNLVPDYVTTVREGGFYGWPWWYLGAHQDPRHAGKHPELKEAVTVPDVLIQPHNASLQIAFYEGGQFPEQYRGDIFATEHGSWNRSIRTGYEVIRIPLHGTGKPDGGYEDFVTGFVLPDGRVWGRPVGVTTASDGALLITDDGSNAIWRVAYTGN